MRLALYQPDIAGNAGAIIRLTACLGVPLDIIEPCGFPLGERTLKRAAMDYGAHAEIVRHADWAAFRGFAATSEARLVLCSVHAERAHHAFAWCENDILLMGSESGGVPDAVRSACDAAVRIPMVPGMRSMNVAIASGIALAEALRQTRWRDQT